MLNKKALLNTHVFKYFGLNLIGYHTASAKFLLFRIQLSDSYGLLSAFQGFYSNDIDICIHFIAGEVQCINLYLKELFVSTAKYVLTTS